MRYFHSIEYRDSDGDLNIRHDFMSQDEADQLLAWFTKNGIQATINQLGIVDIGRPVLNAANHCHCNVLNGQDSRLGTSNPSIT